MAIQQKKLPCSMITEVPGHEQLKVEFTWKSSGWLPVFLDSRLQSLAFSRKAFVLKYPKAGTNIDTDILFQNAKDILLYLPRAFYIGFFMPTLDLSFQKGINPGGTLMRRVIGFEMIFLYFCYPFPHPGRMVLEEKIRVLDIHPLGYRRDSYFYPGFTESGRSISVPIWVSYVPGRLRHF